MKIAILCIVTAILAGLAVGQSILIVHGIGSWLLLIVTVATASVAGSLLWGEVVDR
ncbi:hypothetical protein GS504_24240 [Rhodococcus hoagii]|nr:hypothetical protein [Prescottella equi]NKS60565.1 hypothetical protein [Prescottella equi]